MKEERWEKIASPNYKEKLVGRLVLPATQLTPYPIDTMPNSNIPKPVKTSRVTKWNPSTTKRKPATWHVGTSTVVTMHCRGEDHPDSEKTVTIDITEDDVAAAEPVIDLTKDDVTVAEPEIHRAEVAQVSERQALLHRLSRIRDQLDRICFIEEAPLRLIELAMSSALAQETTRINVFRQHFVNRYRDDEWLSPADLSDDDDLEHWNF